jgi:hypothetical protein
LHPAGDEAPGHLIGEPVELGIADVPPGGRDVHRGVAEPLAGLSRDLSQHSRRSSMCLTLV